MSQEAEIEKFTNKANQIYVLSKNVISMLLGKGYPVDALYIKLNPSRPSVIISVANEHLNDDNFIELGYSEIHESQKIFAKLFGEHLDLGLISNENLDEALLKEDGFGYVEKY